MTRIRILCDVDGTLTDGTVIVGEDGTESLRFHKRDAWLLADARARGVGVTLITSEVNHHAALARGTKLGLALLYAPSPEAKREEVRRAKAGGAKVLYIGDALADLLAMEEADAAACPYDGYGAPGVHRLAVCGGDGVLHSALSIILSPDGAFAALWEDR